MIEPEVAVLNSIGIEDRDYVEDEELTQKQTSFGVAE